MRLADIQNVFHNGKTLIVVKGVRDNATGNETTETITINADDLNALTYEEKYESHVIMFEAPAQDVLKVWTWREINAKNSKNL